MSLLKLRNEHGVACTPTQWLCAQPVGVFHKPMTDKFCFECFDYHLRYWAKQLGSPKKASEQYKTELESMTNRNAILFAGALCAYLRQLDGVCGSGTLPTSDQRIAVLIIFSHMSRARKDVFSQETAYLFEGLQVYDVVEDICDLALDYEPDFQVQTPHKSMEDMKNKVDVVPFLDISAFEIVTVAVDYIRIICAMVKVTTALDAPIKVFRCMRVCASFYFNPFSLGRSDEPGSKDGAIDAVEFRYCLAMNVQAVFALTFLGGAIENNLSILHSRNSELESLYCTPATFNLLFWVMNVQLETQRSCKEWVWHSTSPGDPAYGNTRLEMAKKVCSEPFEASLTSSNQILLAITVVQYCLNRGWDNAAARAFKDLKLSTTRRLHLLQTLINVRRWGMGVNPKMNTRFFLQGWHLTCKLLLAGMAPASRDALLSEGKDVLYALLNLVVTDFGWLELVFEACRSNGSNWMRIVVSCTRAANLVAHIMPRDDIAHSGYLHRLLQCLKMVANHLKVNGPKRCSVEGWALEIGPTPPIGSSADGQTANWSNLQTFAVHLQNWLVQIRWVGKHLLQQSNLQLLLDHKYVLNVKLLLMFVREANIVQDPNCADIEETFETMARLAAPEKADKPLLTYPRVLEVYTHIYDAESSLMREWMEGMEEQSELWREQRVKAKVEEKMMARPNYQICCLSQEPMVNPVMTSDGQLYEKSYIQKWLLTHNTSPATGKELPDKRLTAPPKVREEIASWEWKEHCRAMEFAPYLESASMAEGEKGEGEQEGKGAPKGEEEEPKDEEEPKGEGKRKCGGERKRRGKRKREDSGSDDDVQARASVA